MAKCFSSGVPSLLCRVHLANGEVLAVWMASVQQFVDELEQKVLELLGLGDDTGEEAETTALLGLAHVKGKDVQWLKRGVRMQDFGIPLTKCHKNVAPGDDVLGLQMDLHLLIKFVPPSVCSLAEPVVALLFFHHARMQFFKGQIHLAIEQYIRCWVCLLLLSESNMAPMDNDDSSIVELFPPPPVPLLRHFQLGLDDVQQMVHDQFRTMRAQQSDPMEMLVEFLHLCASAPLFGCSFFSVRDKSGNDWSLALNGRAMAQLDPLDPYRPKRVWGWNSVGNFHRNGETEFVLEMLSTNKVARHASLVYPLGKQPSPSLPLCHSPPALSQWPAASTSSPRAPHRICFRCEHPRQCQSLWEFAVAQHRWHLHSNCREMGTKLHFTQNSEAVRRQLVTRLRKHFLPSTEEDALSLASIGAKFTPSLLSAATSSSSIASSSSSFSSLSLPFPSSSSSSSSFPLLLHFPCRMPAARVADRSPMAHLPMRESARSQQQHHHQTKESLPEEEVEPKQHQQQQKMNAPKSEEECRRENEICTRLMELRERLEEQLITRLEELKGICVVEGDLTGQLPKEIYKCLLPDEMEPTVKRRVGTTFKFPQEVLTIRRQNDDNDNGNDEPDENRQLSQLSAEIELNRRIVAAAERLAKDKSANKSVRKKRRKDLQAAAQRLRSLEKGLHRMRLSSSKPDVSSLAMADGTAAASAASIGRQSGSGFSLNSLKAWPNFYHTLRMSNNTKSCPATPRGSVPDLSMTNAAAVSPAAVDNVNGASDNCRRTTPSTAKKLHKMLSRDHLISNQPVVSVSISQHSEVPSSSSSSSLSGHPSSSSGISSAAPSLSSSSNLLIMAPPPVPSRRSSSGSSISTGGGGGRPTPPHHRRGGTPTTKNSSPTEFDRTEAAARQQQQQSACGNHLYANIGYQSSSPYKSAYRQCQFPTIHQQMSPPPLSAHLQPLMTSSTSFSALKDVASCRPCTSSSASSLLTAAASTQLGQIVRRLDAAHPLRVPLIVGRAGGVQGGQAHSTGSLDRRLRRVPTTTTMKMASSTTSASAICPPAFHQLPPPPLPRTTAIEELVERDQLVTTFPAVSDRCDNGTIIQLLKASSDFARFRSISAVLDKSARGDCSEMHFPRPNDRMEALLASIHRQSRVGSIASDISTNSATPNNDGGGGGTTTTTTTLV